MPSINVDSVFSLAASLAILACRSANSAVNPVRSDTDFQPERMANEIAISGAIPCESLSENNNSSGIDCVVLSMLFSIVLITCSPLRNISTYLASSRLSIVAIPS